MTYYLERDGIMAFPDDPMRVGTPEFIDIDDDEIQSLADCYAQLAKQVLTGALDSAVFDQHLHDPAALWELVTDGVEPDELAHLLVGRKDIAEKMIDRWARELAENEILGE